MTTSPRGVRRFLPLLALCGAREGGRPMTLSLRGDGLWHVARLARPSGGPAGGPAGGHAGGAHGSGRVFGRSLATCRGVADDATGSGFGGSYSGWQSTMFSNSRRAIFGQAPGDLRQDLTPWNRMAMIRKCRWAERNSGLFKQILNDMVLYSVGDGIKAQSHASTPPTIIKPAPHTSGSHTFAGSCRDLLPTIFSRMKQG